jgi:hypothetical protein
MKKTFFCTIILFFNLQCLASQPHKSCWETVCSAGDTGITYSSKSEPYYACPTRELTDYTSFVLGLVSMNIELTGKMPNISDKTGEPEYLDGEDGPNKTRLMLENLRNKAKVSTFDEAANICSKGVGDVKVLIMNSQDDSGAIWVMDERIKNTFWMPKSNLDKR